MASPKEFTTITKFPIGTPFQQAFELLTSSLLLHDGKEGSGIDTVCVTATQLGSGVSTTALNLALTIAGSGRRTLLIDANLRAPTLHQPFNFSLSPGLAEILMKKATFKDAVRATRTSNLYLMPAGAPAGSPQPLLQPALLGPVFEQAKSNYDFAIVDTPPALRYSDATHIARFTNGVILVLPADGAPRRAEIEVRRRLERADVNILGIVINRISLKDAMSTY